MRSILIIALALTMVLSYSQDYPVREYDLEKIAENIFPVQDEDIDYSQLYENLAQILSNPIDLNEATDEQLRSLYILNETQIHNLIVYRDSQGAFLSIYELQSIEGFTQDVISKIIPFVTIRTRNLSATPLWKRIVKEQNNYLLYRHSRTLESKKGFSGDFSAPAHYIGSPDRLYTRFRTARAADFSIGFTVEKDPGEKINWTPDKKLYGFDYNSFHVQLMNKGLVKNFIIGDYQAQFGQGLILGGGFGMGKGAETITTVRRSNTGFLPYTSLTEAGFFRGLAISIRPIKYITVNAFASRNWRDGSISSDSLGLSLSSVSVTGLHRTATEIANRKIFLETNYGAVISFKKRDFELGSIVHQTEFNIPIFRNPTPYNQYYFSGSNNTNAGLYLNYNLKNLAFFSETATTFGRGKALVLGALGSLTSSFDIALHYRYYDKNFQTFYGNALSENSTVQNESGYYLGWKYKVNAKHVLSGYSDLFRFPWLRYRGYTPSSSGHEWLIRYAYQPNKETLIYVQAREESKIRNLSNDSNLYGTENGIKRNYWINMDYALGPNLSFKSRVQFSTYQLNSSLSRGFAIIQDFNFKLKKFTFSTRFALFDTDDFDNRQYVYERDAWLAFSFPFYNGVGVRNYVLIQYPVSKKVDMWLRWSRFNYTDRETIGSGNETISGNSTNDVKLQARIRF